MRLADRGVDGAYLHDTADAAHPLSAAPHPRASPKCAVDFVRVNRRLRPLSAPSVVRRRNCVSTCRIRLATLVSFDDVVFVVVVRPRNDYASGTRYAETALPSRVGKDPILPDFSIAPSAMSFQCHLVAHLSARSSGKLTQRGFVFVSKEILSTNVIRHQFWSVGLDSLATMPPGDLFAAFFPLAHVRYAYVTWLWRGTSSFLLFGETDLTTPPKSSCTFSLGSWIESALIAFESSTMTVSTEH